MEYSALLESALVVDLLQGYLAMDGGPDTPVPGPDPDGVQFNRAINVLRATAPPDLVRQR